MLENDSSDVNKYWTWYNQPFWPFRSVHLLKICYIHYSYLFYFKTYNCSKNRISYLFSISTQIGVISDQITYLPRWYLEARPKVYRIMSSVTRAEIRQPFGRFVRLVAEEEQNETTERRANFGHTDRGRIRDECRNRLREGHRYADTAQRS